MKIFIDHDFNHRILRGLIKLIPEADFVTAYEIGGIEKSDSEHILWATNENRLILTHDIRTFPSHAAALIEKGHEISGIILVPQNMPIGNAVEELELILSCGSSEEFKNLIIYLPWLN
jgi:predicted nuclease of predicted toxin-antitoxin system